MNNKAMDEEKTLELIKELTVQDFLNIGLDQVAYIKRHDNSEFSVHAADGSQISVMDSYDTAMASIRVNDLFPVTVH